MITNYFSVLKTKGDGDGSDEKKQLDKGKRKTSEEEAQKGEDFQCESIPRHHPLSTMPDFSYTPQFLALEEQTELIKHLNDVPWSKVKYTNKFDQAITTPRHTFCYGTPQNFGESAQVEYKGCFFVTEKIPEWLEKIKVNVEKYVGFEFNAIILNNYTDGNEYISWHKDDEAFLKHNTVASLSLGASRTFQVRRVTESSHKKHKSMRDSSSSCSSSEKKSYSNTSVILISGSLCVLYNGIEHHLPKEAPISFKGMKNRYNITFRSLKDFKLGDKMSGWGNYYYYNRGGDYQIKTENEH
eukprot:TRINITY_DN2868_c0_g4_i1.p1 TRINITY_DN2868_c0_g4~~TRINITY_DN2868_c0_g4_i1.p1  ORF type:complete len:298 (-),score=47.70 TRINITY_DN2868_c0_g4_i1:145-1038(-)